MTAAPEDRQVVLVCLDGSPAAELALPVAQTVAGQLGLGVEILDVFQDSSRGSERSRTQFPSAARVRRREGDTASAILDAAAEADIALVVLTTHGRTLAPDRGLGSVATAVIARTQRPILLVRPEAAAGQDEAVPPLRRLLVPIDGTPTTTALLQPVLDLAVRMGASLDVLYVGSAERPGAVETGSVHGPRYVDQPQHEWRHWGGELAHRLRSGVAAWPGGVPVQTYFAHGAAAAEIARFATEHGSDAIVLVRRSRLERGRARVLREVLQRTRCPVLLVGG